MVTRLGFLFLTLGLVFLRPAKGDDEEQAWSFTCPLDGKSAQAKDALLQMQATLSSIHAEKGQAPKISGALGKSYVLYGDLFGNGACYALVNIVDLEIGVGFAKWSGDQWQIKTLWRMSPEWRPEGWKKSDDDYFPVTPVTRPFWTMDLNGKGALGIVIANEVIKYGQLRYIFAFDAKKERLNFLDSTPGEPCLENGLLVLSYNSGRRAIYEEWLFHQYDEGHLQEKARWRDESPYNGDPHFVSGSGEKFGFTATDAPDVNAHETHRTLSDGEKVVGEIFFRWQQPEEENLDRQALENAFLFEKFTGLPRKLFPSANNSKKALEDVAKVRVTGNAEVMKLFTSKPVTR